MASLFSTTTMSDSGGGGTGARFGNIVITLAGISALIASLLTCVSVWLQAKNYRKPLLQRYVIRMLLMVPIYSASSWASLVSLKAAFWIGPLRDVYEAFTIYTFLQLLVNFIGGERALIILMHGRRPVEHLWPLNYVFAKVDISDPHTFLAIKRGILQYTWLKPILAIATIIMKATGTYQEGYIGLNSGYFWSGLVYNISITISLYALALFWVCMLQDLKPFRPMPKFLCVKGIIFASYWQGFFLSILVWLGALPDKESSGYSPDNLAAAIQDGLICFEMPFFAIAHWYAFSWHDYADVTISAARMPVKYALRDAFGPRDLIEDAKETFSGKNYEYRYFDAHDNVLAHEDSASRTARMMEGMRYGRGGKGKYWIPKHGDDSRTPLLFEVSSSRARTMVPSSRPKDALKYGTTSEEDEDISLNPEDENLYANARALEFGDWNYPVITAHTATRENRLYANPSLVTGATNRHVLQPTSVNEERRKNRIKQIQESAHTGKHRGSSSSGEGSKTSQKARKGVAGKLLQRTDSSSSTSGKSDKSQLVDLVVEDREAEAIERVRARKEGGPGWNQAEPKHFVRTYPATDEEEVVREGFDPTEPQSTAPQEQHNLDAPFTVGDESEGGDGDERGGQASDEALNWRRREYDGGSDDGGEGGSGPADEPRYGSFREERNVWGSSD